MHLATPGRRTNPRSSPECDKGFFAFDEYGFELLSVGFEFNYFFWSADNLSVSSAPARIPPHAQEQNSRSTERLLGLLHGTTAETLVGAPGGSRFGSGPVWRAGAADAHLEGRVT